MRKNILVVAAILVTGMLLVSAALVEAADKNIVVMWVGKSGMAKRVFTGFVTRLKVIAPNVKLTLKREIPTMKEAQSMFQNYESSMDGIVFLRSTGAKFLGTVQPKVPCFVGACNNPQFLGAVKNMKSPQGNVTGVTYFIPYDKRFRIIKGLFPKVKSVCLLVEKGHPSTPIDQQGTQEQCKLLGISYSEVVAENGKDLITRARAASSTTDLFIIGNQAVIIDNTANLLQIANQTKTPMFSYADKAVKIGAVAAMSADDQKLGGLLAHSVTDVVVKGKPISAVPVKMDPSPQIVINKLLMDAMGLKFPATILEHAKLID